MKLRTGFVSNSSTSSFIIQINQQPEKCPHCGRSGVDLVKFMMGFHNHWETSLDFTDPDEKIDELERELKDHVDHGWEHDYLDEQLEQLRAAKATGKPIIGIDLNYHDDALKMVIDDLAAAGDITILQEEY
jgi:hypothetical protein